MDATMNNDDYTKILNQASIGDSFASTTLFDEIYRELKMMARRQVNAAMCRRRYWFTKCS